MLYVDYISVCTFLAEQLALREMTLNDTFFKQMRATKIHSWLLLEVYYNSDRYMSRLFRSICKNFLTKNTAGNTNVKFRFIIPETSNSNYCLTGSSLQESLFPIQPPPPPQFCVLFLQESNS